MKNTLIISRVALTAILVGLSSAFASTFAQTSSAVENQMAKTIIVKCTQSINKGVSFIRIYYGNDKIERIELEKVVSIPSEENNFNKIVTTLNRLNTEGYEVISSTELATPGNNISSFTLKKKSE